MLRAVLLLSLFTWCFVVPAVAQEDPPPATEDRDGWWSREAFDALDAGINDGEGYAAETNDDGRLAWGQSYVMMAYAAMYRATGDAAYLETLLTQAEAVMEHRDDRRDPPVRDVFRDAVVPGWSSRRYTQGRPYVWAVHTGMITAPVLEGLYLARQHERAHAGEPEWDPETGETTYPDAPELVLTWERRDALLAACREAIDAHAGQWRDGPGDGEGYLYGSYLGRYLPLNQQNALGRAYVWLARLLDEEDGAPYADKARGLLRYFKNRLRYSRERDMYSWAYNAPPEGEGEGFEDISHAAINVDFACLGAANNWVFEPVDLSRLRRTLLATVMAPATPTDTVGGTGGAGRYAPQVGRWLALADGNAEVWNRIRDYFAEHRPAETATGLLTLANLRRYRPR